MTAGTRPQYRYKPVGHDGGFMVESVVYGGNHITGGWSRTNEYVNFVAACSTEDEAISICSRLREST